MFRVLTLLALSLFLVAGCSNQPKKSVKDMQLSLGRSVYAMNKAINNRQFDEARLYVAAEAVPAFEQLTGGIVDRRYGILVAESEPAIDYLRGRAIADVSYLESIKTKTPGSAPTSRPVERSRHQWRYEGGEWRWYGPLSPG